VARYHPGSSSRITQGQSEDARGRARTLQLVDASVAGNPRDGIACAFAGLVLETASVSSATLYRIRIALVIR
jgi:hypothetical protein